MSETHLQPFKGSWSRKCLCVPFYAFLICVSVCVCAPPSAFRCVWCQTTVHDDCMDGLTADQCELGEFRNLIIPPHYLHRVNKLRRRTPEEYSQVLRCARAPRVSSLSLLIFS